MNHRAYTLFTLALCLLLPQALYAQTSADFSGGSVIVGESTDACSGTIAGAIRYNTTTDCAEYCDGTDWTCPSSGGGSCDTTPVTFTTPGLHAYAVPQGCTSLAIEAYGAGGGHGRGGGGGGSVIFDGTTLLVAGGGGGNGDAGGGGGGTTHAGTGSTIPGSSTHGNAGTATGGGGGGEYPSGQTNGTNGVNATGGTAANGGPGNGGSSGCSTAGNGQVVITPS